MGIFKSIKSQRDEIERRRAETHENIDKDYAPNIEREQASERFELQNARDATENLDDPALRSRFDASMNEANAHRERAAQLENERIQQHGKIDRNFDGLASEL